MHNVRPGKTQYCHIAMTLAALLLNACSVADAPSQPADDKTASLDSTELSYADIRAILAEDYAVGADGKFKSPVVEEKFETFKMAPMFRGCTYGSSSYNAPFGIAAQPETMSDSGEFEEMPEDTGGGDTGDSFEQTAIIDVQLSSYLRRLKIPEPVYKAPLDKWIAASRSGDPKAFEIVPFSFDYRLGDATPIYETEIARLDGDLINGINANIDKAGLQEKIRLEPDEGCGAGDVPYRIQTTPSKSVVSVIQTIYFKLCRARKIDPYDKVRCDGWKDLRDGQLAFMAGDYQWTIGNNGPTQKRGKLSLFGEEMAEEIPLKIGD